MRENKNILPNINDARLRNRPVKIIYKDVQVPSSLLNFPYPKTFYIKTYGCQANYRDEETIAGLLCYAGFKRVDNIQTASIIFFNTCAVRENAEQKLFGHLGELKAIKQKDKNKIICVSGCMMQERESLQFLVDTYKYVSIIFGTHNIASILDLLDEYLSTKKMLIRVPSNSDEVVENLPSYRSSLFKAFVNITYGCNKFCTYCVVPYTRGQERSRLMEDILKECRFLKENDYQEITLLGQNVNAYGKDLKDGSNFAKLLEEVAKMNFPRIKFLTSYPSEFDDDLIDVIAKYDNISKYIHLPVQSGSNVILQAMVRRYSKEAYLDLVKRMRAKIPNLRLSTDIIVGFPNESEEDFLETLDLVQKADFASAFTFIYSKRKDTPAAKIVDKVSYETKVERFKRLVKLLEQHISAYDAKAMNQLHHVLVESVSEKDPTMLSGYDEDNKLIHFKGDTNLIGKIVKVKVKESHMYSLIGELIDE